MANFTPDQVTALNFQDFYQTIKPYLGLVHGGYTPVGSLLIVYSTTAPVGYVKCDGTTYQLSAYPELSYFFKQQFGSVNHFGGDGTSTFAVPHLVGAPVDAIYCIATKNIYIDPERTANTYSTEEQVVGTWIDGKPLYQIVIPITGTWSNTYDVTCGTVPNFSTIQIKMMDGYGLGNRNGTSFNVNMNYAHPRADQWAVAFYVYSNGDIKLCIGSSETIVNPVFIVKYTKDSD